MTTTQRPKTWLLAHLIRSGHVTETGASRRARVRTCSRCKTPVMTGLDDVTCALEVTCDPQPLNALGEALALVERRRTLTLHREGGHYVLDHRCAADIRATPAGTGTREDVLREHRCRTPLPDELTAPTSYAEAAPPLPAHAAPPF